MPIAACPALSTGLWTGTDKCWADAPDNTRCRNDVDPDPETLGLCTDHHEQFREWSR